MKKISVILLLLAILASLFACSGKEIDVPDGMQLASGDEVAYRLFVPGGWIITESNGICGAYYSTNDKSSITMSSFYPEGDMLSINDYWQSCENSYSETYKNFVLEEKPIDNASNAMLGEKPAFKYVFTADIDGSSYKFMQLVTVHDNMFYTLTYTSSADNYSSHLEDIEKTASEIIFK